MELHLVKALNQVQSEVNKDQKPKDEPRHKEGPPPGPDAMAGKAVAHGRHRGKEGKEASNHDHPVLISHLISQGKNNECEAGYEVTNVKEKEASQKTLGCL